MKKDKNRVVVGAGYVGIAVAIALSTNNNIVLYDIDQEKVQLMLSGKSPINDEDMRSFFEVVYNEQTIEITSSIEGVFEEADFVVLAVPTSWDTNNHHLDISVLCGVLEQISKRNKQAIIIIKSTLPVGTMDLLTKKYPDMKIVYVPEFLREGTAVKDEKNLSRLVIGTNEQCESCGGIVQKLFLDIQDRNDVPVLHMSGGEAELVKLYSNVYLAMRVAFFNELDTYAEIKQLNTKKIIDGVSLDPRIGAYYNVPSFGYGGYCLPKDSKELALVYENIPASLIPTIVRSNAIRKEYIATRIINIIESKNVQNPVIGIYRVNMKRNSDNCRGAAILDIISFLSNRNYSVLIYDPLLNEIPGCKVKMTSDLEFFIKASDVIVANRITDEIANVVEKVYTRDTDK